jgi:hypothetical protein
MQDDSAAATITGEQAMYFFKLGFPTHEPMRFGNPSEVQWNSKAPAFETCPR